MAKKANSGHILIIRLSAMGDVAMTVPVILGLKESYPDIQITVLTKRQFKPIFDELPDVSVVVAEVNSKHKGFFGLWRLFKKLKSISITHVADLHNVLRSKILSFFFRINGFKVSVLDKGRFEKKALTRAKNKKWVQLKMTVERYQEVFEALGFKVTSKSPKYLLTRKLSNFVKPYFPNKDGFCIGIAPFAAHSGKMYHLDLMEEVIRQLMSNGKLQIVLFGGGAKETELLDEMSAKLGEKVQSAAGKLSFEEELALMLAMDSGNGHLAANYGVPVITVWGVTHPFAGFVPYNQSLQNSITPDLKKYPLIPTSVYGNVYPKGYEQAINSIAPGDIVQRINEVLNAS